MRSRVRLRDDWTRMPWGRMHVWRAGRGPVVLAIHGLGGSGRYWGGLARRVGDRFTIVAPDLPGFGRSDKPDVAYDRGFHLDALDEVLRHRGDDGPPVVLGHSLGGVFAALWAARHLTDVAGLALAATPFPTGEEPPAWTRRPPPAPLRLAAGVARAALPLVAVPLGVVRGYPPALVMDFGRQRFHSRVGTMVSALWDPGVVDDLRAAAEIPASVPTLLVNARDDRTVPLTDQERWSALFPHAERRTLDDGGHQFPLRSEHCSLAEWLLALPER